MGKFEAILIHKSYHCPFSHKWHVPGYKPHAGLSSAYVNQVCSDFLPMVYQAAYLFKNASWGSKGNKVFLGE
ncbi:MAG: hypothetical protein ABIF10_04455, partial [Candidatus Woesearchaeota archaeon]